MLAGLYITRVNVPSDGRDQEDSLDAVLINVTGRVEEVLHKLIGVLLANHLASGVNDGADVINELLALFGERLVVDTATRQSEH